MAQRSYTPRADGFDSVKVTDAFRKAVAVTGVSVPAYLDAFEELARFNDMMGALFALQASDIRYQVRLLHSLLQGPEAVHYRTVQALVTHESADPGSHQPHLPGSRAILHLHRTLDFFRRFVRASIALPDEGALYPTGADTYKATLAQHHAWWLTKAARLAMRTLPTKAGLCARVSKYGYEETVTAIAAMVDAMDEVFAAVDQLFTLANLHSLAF